MQFVVNEIQVHLTDQVQLAALLKKYHGTILRDGTPPVIPGGRPRGTPKPSHDYLIRIDPASSPVDDLERNMQVAGVRSPLLFSSPDAVRVVALAARERALRVGLNFIMQPLQRVPEGANRFGNDAAKWPWMAAAGAPNSLGIGVIEAWNYAKYKGLPPEQGFFRPPIVAVLDGGFDLDGTGKPNNGNIDYHFFGNAPINYDLISHSGSAGGPDSCVPKGCSWHGQLVFGIAAAYPRNNFGTAGTGGEAVLPMLIKTDLTTSLLAYAVRAAAFNGASVANISLGAACPISEFCRAFDLGRIDILQSSINLADSWGTIVVAGAGDAREPANNQFDFIPCTLNNVVCVGAIKPWPPGMSQPYSGAGSRVDIWAPDCIWSTPIQPDLTTLPEVCGTSAAAPFVAGVVALLKGLNPRLSATEVATILRRTALSSSDRRVVPGYINALGAVQASSPNQPPTITIVAPAVASVPWGRVHFASHINDPEQPGRLDGIKVQWSSNLDGMLCNGLECEIALNTLGTHTIKATVTDPFGANTSQTIPLTVIDVPPTVAIFSPMASQIFAAGVPIHLRGTASSPSQILPDANLTWTSSAVAAPLASGYAVDVTLPAGVQTITLTARDAKGGMGKANVPINVIAGLDVPSVRIVAPPLDNPDSNFVSVKSGQAITFQGQVIDPVDATGMTLEWVSDQDGVLGTTDMVRVTLSGGACGIVMHKVTLRATNKVGNSAADLIQVAVGNIC